jgi:hypothetical protein
VTAVPTDTDGPQSVVHAQVADRTELLCTGHMSSLTVHAGCGKPQEHTYLQVGCRSAAAAVQYSSRRRVASSRSQQLAGDRLPCISVYLAPRPSEYSVLAAVLVESRDRSRSSLKQLG